MRDETYLSSWGLGRRCSSEVRWGDRSACALPGGHKGNYQGESSGWTGNGVAKSGGAIAVLVRYPEGTRGIMKASLQAGPE